MSIDPNFHFTIEELAVTDQKRTTPAVFDYLKHTVKEEKKEVRHDLIKVIERYQEHMEREDAEEDYLLSLVILQYLKHHIHLLNPKLLSYLEQIRKKCERHFSEKQKEEFEMYFQAAKVQKFMEEH